MRASLLPLILDWTPMRVRRFFDSRRSLSIAKSLQHIGPSLTGPLDGIFAGAAGRVILCQVENVTAKPMQRFNLHIPGFIRYAPALTSVALAALIGFLGWNSLTIFRTAASPANSAEIAGSNAPARVVSGERIADAHLFGIAANSVANGPVVIPPSSWHVVGVVVGTSPKDSAADIVIDGAEHTWHLGDRLPDGSTLASIDSHGITTSLGTDLLFELQVISYDDHFDTLPLNGGDGDGSSFETVAAPPTAHPDKSVPLANRMTELRAAEIGRA